MTQQNERLPAFGDSDGTPDGDNDFASEHGDTAVDPAIIEDEDTGEQESPRGWSGMDGDGPP